MAIRIILTPTQSNCLVRTNKGRGIAPSFFLSQLLAIIALHISKMKERLLSLYTTLPRVVGCEGEPAVIQAQIFEAVDIYNSLTGESAAKGLCRWSKNRELIRKYLKGLGLI